VLQAAGEPVDVVGLVGMGIGLLFVVAGNYLGKTRSTFLFGIRTPWTLTSELSWSRTNRLGGRLMVILGLATILATVVGLRGAALFALIVAGSIGLGLATLAYSYVVWRDDAGRRSFGR
jgi:uncharacterized membrane protein